MHKLFKLQYNKFITKYLTKSEPGIGFDNIQLFFKKNVFKPGDTLLLKKFPLSELKNVARLECNIEGFEQNSKNDDHEGLKDDSNNNIKNTNNRHRSRNKKHKNNNPQPDPINNFYNPTETIINSSKSLRATLNIKEKLVCNSCSKKNSCKFFEIEGNKTATLLDLQFVLHGMYAGIEQINQNKLNQFKLSNNKNNSDLTNNFADKENYSDEVKKDNSSIDVLFQSPIVARVQNKDWNSANILMELINDSYEDILYNNGIVLKTLINSLIEAKKEDEAAKIVSDEQLELSEKSKKEKDPYIQLFEDLKNCTNRREKRRLLAKFNHTVGFGLGEYKKIIPPQPDPQEEEGSRENVHLALPSYKKGKQALEHFSQKISLKNAKYKAIKSQENMSLLVNKDRSGEIESDNSYVKVPGKLYKQAINYITNEDESSSSQDRESNEAILDNFKMNVQLKRDNKSVDINKVVNRKYNKVDKKLQENKRFTLQELDNKNDAKELIDKRKNEKLAISDFELKLINSDSTMLENESGNSLVERSSSLAANISTNELVEAKETTVFREVYNASPQMSFYKQENPLMKDKVQKGQLEAQYKKLKKNKHVYSAQHHYNNDFSYLPFEKDADISRAIRFEKSIKK